jgi:hypothetical protein
VSCLCFFAKISFSFSITNNTIHLLQLLRNGHYPAENGQLIKTIKAMKLAECDSITWEKGNKVDHDYNSPAVSPKSIRGDSKSQF